MIGYPLPRLYEEVAYVSFHLNWSYDQVMQMEHQERHQWVSEIAKINRRINSSAGNEESSKSWP